MDRETRDPTDLIGQEQDAIRNMQKEDLLRLNREEDFRWLMNSPRGRRFVWRLLEMARIFATSYDGNVNNTLFNEGKRNVGLMIFADINELTPNLYETMVRENTGKDEG